MPFYEFKSKNPESPYYNNPKCFMWTFKKYMTMRDKVFCEVTGEKLERIPSAGMINLKGKDWTKSGTQ